MQDSVVAELVVDEIMIETLEADNLVLQNMSSNKYVQVSLLERMPMFFKNTMTSWRLHAHIKLWANLSQNFFRGHDDHLIKKRHW